MLLPQHALTSRVNTYPPLYANVIMSKVKFNNGVEAPVIGSCLISTDVYVLNIPSIASGSWAPPTPEAQAKVTSWILTALKVCK